MSLKTAILWLTAALCFSASSPAQEPSPAVPSAAPTPKPAAATAASTARKQPASTAADIAVHELTSVASAEEAFTLRYGNRPITVFRARLLGRTPEERAASTVDRLDELADQGLSGPVASRLMGGVCVVTVAGQEAVLILPTDVDTLAGETLEATGLEAAESLRQAMAEVAESRSPARLLRAGLRALAATVVALLLAFTLLWVRDRAARRAATWVESSLLRALDRHGRAEIWRAVEVRLFAVVHFLGRLLLIALEIAIGYTWLTFVLRQFPYTRPWGEALRGFVFATLIKLGGGMVAAVPGLFTVVLIVLITRLVIRLVNILFRAVEQSRVTLPGVYADTAQPTRRLAIALLWLFAVVVAYPYLPGSGTDAFKGVSVFVGLMVSLGSSGLVNQAMSSFMITYSRALRLGDYVRIGDVEGTVVHSGLLSTKIRTRRNEEVTFPNAVVAGTTITNFSRHSDAGVFARTSVTIGYDTPWRQVEALLLEAAARTAGVRAEPRPFVLQTGLHDYYVEYTLAVAPERPDDRLQVLSDLHAQIQDCFNEHGVQIMSPHYVADPQAPKVVPKREWFAAPASPDTGKRKTSTPNRD